MDVRQELKKAFALLNDEQFGNLLWHVQNGTRICCGAGASMYIDGGGGG